MKPALCACAILCLSLAWSPDGSAQDAPARDRPVHPANSAKASYAALDKLPDWRGLWFPVIGKVGGAQPVLIGDAKKTFDAHQAQLKANPRYEVPETSDNCEPDGMPSLMTFPYNLEILFTPGKVTIIQEALMQVRRIFTDGRPLPRREAVDPNYFGYSVGRWDGETLVVTTIGTKPGQRLGIAGITNSDQLTITERIYLDPKDRDLLHLEFTFADPKVLAEPWRRTHMFRRDRTWEQIEYICVQNNRHQIDETGQTVVPR
jgi:hypothetical protein